MNCDKNREIGYFWLDATCRDFPTERQRCGCSTCQCYWLCIHRILFHIDNKTSGGSAWDLRLNVNFLCPFFVWICQAFWVYVDLRKKLFAVENIFIPWHQEDQQAQHTTFSSSHWGGGNVRSLLTSLSSSAALRLSSLLSSGFFGVTNSSSAQESPGVEYFSSSVGKKFDYSQLFALRLYLHQL